MKILYIWDSEYPWDIRTQKICSSLKAANYDVHLVARNRKWQTIYEKLPEGTVHRMAPIYFLGHKVDGLLSFPAFFNPRWFRLLVNTIKRTNPKVLIVRDLPLCPTTICVGKKYGLPVVFDMAENYPAMMRDLWTTGTQKPYDIFVRSPQIVSLVERFCLAYSDHVLVVVKESSERLQELGVSKSRISVVSNTPTIERALEIHEHKQTDERLLRLVYLGLMEIPRGIGDIIDALPIAIKSGTKVHLTLIGDGRDRKFFEKKARKLDLLPNWVEFLGYVPNNEALKKIESCHIGLIPHHPSESWNTTIPNKLFDYMAMWTCSTDFEYSSVCSRYSRVRGWFSLPFR